MSLIAMISYISTLIYVFIFSYLPVGGFKIKQTYYCYVLKFA